MTDEINLFRPGGSRYGEVCRHGSLARKCETCDLESDLAEANRDKAEMLALLEEGYALPDNPAWVNWRERVAALLKRLEGKA